MTAYRFPLTPQASWTQNLRNLNPANELVSDDQPLRARRAATSTVSTPAGTFNAIAMRT